jgi:hypothetical protein
MAAACTLAEPPGSREFHRDAPPKIIEITQDHNELLSLYHLIESRKQLTGKRRRDRRGSRRDRRAVKCEEEANNDNQSKIETQYEHDKHVRNGKQN